METKSNPPSTIQTADKSPTVIPLFVGDVACDGGDIARDKVAVGDWVGDGAAYGVNAVEGERVADHMGDELMGDQDTEAVLVLVLEGLTEGLIVCDNHIVVKAVEE
jgi:hypothetical protein